MTNFFIFGHGLLGIISMSVLTPGQKNTENDEHNKNHPTGGKLTCI